MNDLAVWIKSHQGVEMVAISVGYNLERNYTEWIVRVDDNWVCTTTKDGGDYRTDEDMIRCIAKSISVVAGLHYNWSCDYD